MNIWQRNETRIFGLFVFLLVIYLLIAYIFHAPQGYYGTTTQPRFADPWIARTETILSGGLLYRDVFTTTPPLTNLLLIPPSLIPIFRGNINPWATLSYMLYFSLFNLAGALILLYMGATRKKGFQAAVLFLLNPLTFGNAVLRRQDESIVAFFFGLALYFILKRRHLKAATAIGTTLLIKLSGGLLVPIAYLHSRDWRYLIIPFLVFIVILAPFLIVAGEDAVFWNVNTAGGQHPFQFRGVSLAALWNEFHEQPHQISLNITSVLFVIGAGIASIFVAWKRFGILEDIIIMITVAFLLTPKLHTGYFSILAITMAPLIKTRFTAFLYLLFGSTAMVADFYKWPLVNYPRAFGLMVITLVLLTTLTVLLLNREHKVLSGYIYKTTTT